MVELSGIANGFACCIVWCRPALAKNPTQKIGTARQCATIVYVGMDFLETDLRGYPSVRPLNSPQSC